MITDNRYTMSSSRFIGLSLILLIIAHYFSYLGISYNVSTNEWSKLVYISQIPNTNFFTVALKLISLLIVFFVCLKSVKWKVNSTLYLLCMLGYTCYFTIIMFFEAGIKDTLYMSNVPYMYLLILAFFLMENRCVWENLEKLFYVSLIIYAFLFAFSLLETVLRYGWVMYGNSSTVSYFSQFFWCTVIFVFYKAEKKQSSKLAIICSSFLLIGSIFLRSRSWLFQSIMLLYICVTFLAKGKKKKNLIKGLIIFGITFVIIVVFMNLYFDDYVVSLISKFGKDSRSAQYIEIFHQTNVVEWIFGQGTLAGYSVGGVDNYSFIDNEFVYLSFHYGVPFAILFFLPYVRTAIKCIVGKHYYETWLLSLLFICMWIASINGVSVFNRIVIDFKSLAMPILAGRIYYSIKEGTE